MAPATTNTVSHLIFLLFELSGLSGHLENRRRNIAWKFECRRLSAPDSYIGDEQGAQSPGELHS